MIQGESFHWLDWRPIRKSGAQWVTDQGTVVLLSIAQNYPFWFAVSPSLLLPMGDRRCRRSQTIFRANLGYRDESSSKTCTYSQLCWSTGRSVRSRYTTEGDLCEIEVLESLNGQSHLGSVCIDYDLFDTMVTKREMSFLRPRRYVAWWRSRTVETIVFVSETFSRCPQSFTTDLVLRLSWWPGGDWVLVRVEWISWATISFDGWEGRGRFLLSNAEVDEISETIPLFPMKMRYSYPLLANFKLCPASLKATGCRWCNWKKSNQPILWLTSFSLSVWWKPSLRSIPLVLSPTSIDSDVCFH